MKKAQINNEFFILSALSDGPKHGYAINQWVISTSKKAFSISPGVLYPLLYHLEKEEIIHAEWEPSTTGPQRKIYSLTPKGKKYFSQTIHEWRRFTQTIHKFI